MVTTTLRIEPDLKRAAEQYALDQGLSLQSVFNSALRKFLHRSAQEDAKKLVFPDLDFGGKFDTLTRDDIYDRY